MEKTSVNLCENCPIEQDCCKHLTGLKLTEPEFNELFAPYRNLLTIRLNGPVYEISVKNGGSCPHWKNGCTVYSKRAVECRLFPYTMNQIKISRGKVDISYHSRTNCPFKKQLLMPRSEAEILISSFAEEAFGKGASIKIQYESRWFRVKSFVTKFSRIKRFAMRKIGGIRSS